MGLYTAITRKWLERRFAQRRSDGVFVAHQPIYGVGHPASGRAHQLPCVLRIMKLLDGLRFSSFLDVGGAEGYVSWLVHRLHGARAVTCDLSVQACQRARELFALPAVALDAARLPFADQSFDVVLCSEVVEHVEHPVETLLELQRVARVAVVMTTEELHHDRQAIDDYLFQRPGWPHMERNRLHPDDLVAAFGAGVELRPQADCAPPELPDTAAVRAFLLRHTNAARVDAHTFGVAALWLRDRGAAVGRRHGDAQVVEALLASTVTAEARSAPAEPMPLFLLERLRCPRTGSVLYDDGDALRSEAGDRYPVTNGVPDLFPAAPLVSSAEALQQRLMLQFPGETARHRALLALRDRLWLGDRVERSEFDFADRQQQRGFFANEQLVRRAGTDGFCWHSTGSDPWLVTPCLQRPLQQVSFALRIHNPAYPVDAPVAQLFWKGPDDDTFGEDRCVTVRVANDGRFHTVVFDLRQHPRLPPLIEWLRFDPVDGPAEVDLRSMQLQ